MKVFKHLKLISKPNIQCPIKHIFVQYLKKNRMLADFYIPTLSNDMQIAVQKII